jgi:hypothetical protein
MAVVLLHEFKPISILVRRNWIMFEIEDATIVKETDSAVLVDAPIFDELEWIPQSDSR